MSCEICPITFQNICNIHMYVTWSVPNQMLAYMSDETCQITCQTICQSCWQSWCQRSAQKISRHKPEFLSDFFWAVGSTWSKEKTNRKWPWFSCVRNYASMFSFSLTVSTLLTLSLADLRHILKLLESQLCAVVWRYTFAILFTYCYTDFVHNNPNNLEDADRLRRYFGSVPLCLDNHKTTQTSSIIHGLQAKE